MVGVVVGVVGRAHGVHGEVAVDVRTDEPERRFASGQRLRAEDRPATFTVRSSRDHSGRLLVRFEESWVPEHPVGDSAAGGEDRT